MYNKVIIERYQNQAKFDMARRQIVLDTETTGIDPKQGHRIIEIGCVPKSFSTILKGQS